MEAGEVTITVAGRPTVRMVPVAPRAWRPYSAVAELFDGPDDPSWGFDHDLVDDTFRDPWSAA